VSDDDGPTKWVVMAKMTKSNDEETKLVVGEYKFNKLINLKLFWLYYLRHSKMDNSTLFSQYPALARSTAKPF
jgi:hypothetical protein